MFQKNQKVENIIDAPAYWISPESEIFSLSNNQTHIGMICKKPSDFKLHSQFIYKKYCDNNELKGSEGVTSEEIIKLLIRKGWIRIRYFDQTKQFMIHLDLTNLVAKTNIKPFLQHIKNKKNISEIIIITPDNEKLFSLNSFKKDNLFKEFKDLDIQIFNESDGFYYHELKEKLEKQNCK